MTDLAPRGIAHHPRAPTLAAYAAGALDEARSVVVATHLESCAACRIALADFEALGGACLEEIDPAAMNDAAIDGFWNRTAERRETAATRGARPPLDLYLEGGLAAVKWRPVAPGVAQARLEAKGYRPGVLRLLKIAPGTGVPKHSHGDCELTLILSGAYEDELGVFAAGDLADLDRDDTHEPVAIGEAPCICLVATNAPLVFKSMLGRIVQPFIGM